MAATPTPKPTPASAAPTVASGVASDAAPEASPDASPDAAPDAASNPALAPLQTLDCALPVAVAYSGGADSTALLMAAALRWPGQVRAIHIHHGLQVSADAFALHCAQTCATVQVPLHTVHVNARHHPGESPEDAARKARYQALAQTARTQGVQTVLLGQHADDQVETLLLALSRGAGLPGLAAMPERFERHGVRFVRPLLGVSAQAVRQWLTSNGVAFVDDPTNANTGFTRNRIRHQLLPALERAFPQFRDTFARSARHAAQAQELLVEIAAQDLATVGIPPAILPLRQLSAARQANVLRHWLRALHHTAPSAAQMQELQGQLAACTTRGHRIRIKVGSGFVVREGGVLVFQAQDRA